jgi:hypothetical protein
MGMAGQITFWGFCTDSPRLAALADKKFQHCNLFFNAQALTLDIV